MKKFWDYNKFFAPIISAEFQLTLGEGSTPVYTPVVNWSMPPSTGQTVDNSLPAKTLHVRPTMQDAWFRAKKEFLNPTGTHKDRSFAYWISYWHEKGAKELAIASSGNSAISAAAYCKKAGIRLHAFISPRLAQEKKERLSSYALKTPLNSQVFKGVVIHEELLPRKAAIQFSSARGIPNLLASKYDEGTEGYKTIAFEIAEQLPGVTHIFVPTSSGATLQGMYRGFEILQKEKGIATPRLYAVQTTKVHPIAEVFDQSFVAEEQSHAEAIVDRVAPRRNEIIDILRKTKGGGFIISQRELEEAAEMLEDKDLGWQSVLAFAGFVKFEKEKEKAPHPAFLGEGLAQGTRVLCLFTDFSFNPLPQGKKPTHPD